jgi:hypothetical protein
MAPFRPLMEARDSTTRVEPHRMFYALFVAFVQYHPSGVLLHQSSQSAVDGY